MRTLIIFLILTSTAYGQKAKELKVYVNDLSKSPRYATDDYNHAAGYVFNKCRAWGLDVTYQKVKRSKNVVAWITGGKEIYLLGAHLDTVSSSPGADDNASGSAALLGLARRFSQLNEPSHTLVFVWFCLEERGLVGSQYYANNPYVQGKLIFMLNFDMVGRLKGKPKMVSGSMSDHASFRHLCKVGWYFTGTHSDYHRRSDTADKINYKGMETICQEAFLLIRETVTFPWPFYLEN